MPVGSDGLLWVRELRLVSLVDVSRSTYQSWDTEGLLSRPATGAYTQTHVVEALVAGALRTRLPLTAARNAMNQARAEGLVAEATDRFRTSSPDAYLDLVIDPQIADVVFCFDEAALLHAVREPRLPRTLCIVPLAEALTRAMTGFHNNATSGPIPSKRTRGRPRSEPGTITPLRREE